MEIKDIWFEKKAVSLKIDYEFANLVQLVLLSAEIGNDNSNQLIPESFRIHGENLQIAENTLIVRILLTDLIEIVGTFIIFRSLKIVLDNDTTKNYITQGKYYLEEIKDVRKVNKKTLNHKIVKKIDLNQGFDNSYDNFFLKQIRSKSFEKFRNRLQESSLLSWNENKNIDLKGELEKLCVHLICSSLKFIHSVSLLDIEKIDHQIKKFFDNTIHSTESIKTNYLEAAI